MFQRFFSFQTFFLGGFFLVPTGYFSRSKLNWGEVGFLSRSPPHPQGGAGGRDHPHPTPRAGGRATPRDQLV